MTIFQPIIDFTNKNFRDMTRKLLFTVIAILAAGTFLLNGQTTAVSASDVIMSGYSAKSFSADPVSDGNLETILRC